MNSRRVFLTGAAGAAAAGLAKSQTGRLRVGLIGAGSRGKQLMAQVVASDLADLVAVADIFTLRLQEAQEIAPGIRTYFGHREMLAAEDLDAVVISTPLRSHAGPFIDALESGAHVYVEKTMAYDVDQAKAMRDARNRFPNQAVQVGIQSLSSGAAVDAPLMLADDKVGHVTEVHAGYYRNSSDQFPPWDRDIPAQAVAGNVDWEAFLGDAPATAFEADRLINWRLYLDYSGGAVTELMVHQLGFWSKMLGLGIPDRVTTTGDLYLWTDRREVPDVWSLALHYERAGLMFNWTSSFGNRYFGVREHALGTKGTIEKIGRVRYVPESVTNPTGVEIIGGSPDRSHMDDFFQAARTGGEPSCPFEIGFNTAVACRMALQSLLERRTVVWNAEDETIDSAPTTTPCPIRSRSHGGV